MNRQCKLLIAAVVLAGLALVLVRVPFGREQRPATPVSSRSISAGAPIKEGTGDLVHPRDDVVLANSPMRSIATPRGGANRSYRSAARDVELFVQFLDLDRRLLGSTNIDIRLSNDEGETIESATRTGTCFLGPVHAGTWTLVASAEGRRESRTRLELEEREGMRFLELELRRADELLVRMLTPDGRSLVQCLEAEGLDVRLAPIVSHELPGARISAGQVREEALLRNSRHGAEASLLDLPFHVDFESDRVLHLREPLPAFVSLVLGDTVLQTQRAEADALEVTFVLSTADVRAALASVRVRLVDSVTGVPLANVSGSLDRLDRVSNDKGVLRFTDVPPGEHRLLLVDGKHERVDCIVRLESGRKNDLGVWQLDAASSVSGRFYDADGKGIAMHWNVVAYQADARERPGAIDARADLFAPDAPLAYSDDGFVAAELGRGKYWIRVRGDDHYAPPTLIDTARGSIGGLVIRLFDAVGVTLHFGADDARLVTYEVTDPDGAPVLEGGTIRRTVYFGLGIGTYTLRYRIGDAPVKTRSFEVGKAPLELDL